MKYIYIILASAFLLASCAKTTIDAVAATEPTTNSMVNKETFRHNPPAAAQARKIQMGKAETFTLKNGLQVIVAESHKTPTVSYQLTLKHEPILEGDSKGFVEFAGDLMRRGTNTKSKSEIDESVDFIGARFSTSENGFFASSLTKHSDDLLDVVTDVLYNANFSNDELEKIRTQNLSGLETIKTDADAIASNISSRVNFSNNHPYGEIQSVESTTNIKLEQCKNYYERFFVPNNAYLTIVGDITVEEAKKKASEYFGKWKKRPFKPVMNKKVEMAKGVNVHFGHKEGAVQSVIRVTYPLDLKPGHPDNIGASLMNNILGGSFSSRLFKNLREDKAYTYGAYSSLSPDRLIGDFNANASVRNEVSDSSLTQIFYEMNRLKTELVKQEDLKAMQNYITGSFARAMESPQTIARFALNTIRYNLPADYYETYLEKLNALTSDDILSIAQKYISPENVNIVVAGNKGDVAESLLKFDSDGKIDYYDAFGRTVNYSSVLPSDVTGEMVIKDYIEAIGGMARVKDLKSIQMKMSSDMMGQKISIEVTQKAPNMFAMKVGNGAMVFQEQKFNGTKAMAGGMGQNQVFTEGDQYEALKAQAKMVPQLDYLSDAYNVELKGIEEVEGQKCYKLAVTDPSGKTTSEYYGLENGLLRRTAATQEAMGQTVSITTDMTDYKSSGGMLFPMTTVVSGAMPAPMKMEVESIEVNKEVSDDVFLIEE